MQGIKPGSICNKLLWTLEDELAGQFSRLKPNWKLVGPSEVMNLENTLGKGMNPIILPPAMG